MTKLRLLNGGGSEIKRVDIRISGLGVLVAYPVFAVLAVVTVGVIMFFGAAAVALMAIALPCAFIYGLYKAVLGLLR